MSEGLRVSEISSNGSGNFCCREGSDLDCEKVEFYDDEMKRVRE